MLTKLAIKKLEKLNQNINPTEDLGPYDPTRKYTNGQIINQMKAIIRRRASKEEFNAFKHNINDHDRTGIISDSADEADEVYMQAEDIYLDDNANPTVKSMARHTNKALRLRLAFFTGNNYLGKSRYHNPGIVAHDFTFYTNEGTQQMDENDTFINNIKKRNWKGIPNPAMIMDDTNCIMQNIRIGKAVLNKDYDEANNIVSEANEIDYE